MGEHFKNVIFFFNLIFIKVWLKSFKKENLVNPKRSHFKIKKAANYV